MKKFIFVSTFILGVMLAFAETKSPTYYTIISMKGGDIYLELNSGEDITPRVGLMIPSDSYIELADGAILSLSAHGKIITFSNKEKGKVSDLIKALDKPKHDIKGNL